MDDQIAELINFEAGHVTYQEPFPGADVGFVVEEGKGKVVLSAPHGSRCYRPGDAGDYHQEDEYTAALAHWLHLRLGVPAILMVRRSATDPNSQEECPYKEELVKLVERAGAQLVLDMHGTNHGRNFSVDLGCRGRTPDDCESCSPELVKEFGRLWAANCPGEKPISVNHFAARGPGTIVSFVSAKFQGAVSALQLEINGSYRIPKRKPDATNKETYPVPEQIKSQEKRIRAMLAVIEQFIRPLL